MSLSGINNTGNICFINSTFQCMSNTPMFREFIKIYIKQDMRLIEVINKFNLGKFKAKEIKIECAKILLENEHTDSITDSITDSEKQILKHIIKHSFDIYIYISFKDVMKKLIEKKNKVINIDSFMSITEELSKDTGFEHLFSGEQNDPHEFMMYLFDKIHNSKVSQVKISNPENLSDLEIYSRLLFLDFKSRYENNYSYLVKNLYYYILNCIECSNCKNKSNSVCPNDILCLSIPDLPNDITIYDCLNEMFKIDNINYVCEKCKNSEGNLIEKKLLSEPPSSLIIKLKRYAAINNSNRITKINKMIAYPDILNIQKYFCGNNILKEYKLHGIINHTGSMNGGHYYSYVKNLKEDNKTFNEQWECCNDSRVSNISDEEAMSSQNAYILFYSIL